MTEGPLIGWDQIAKKLGVSVATAIRMRKDLLEHGAIFYLWLGRPPRRRVAAYDRVIEVYRSLDSRKKKI